MSITVEFQPSGRRFTAEPADTLLEAALRSGGSPLYGCVNGSCGECKAQVISGETETVRFHDFSLPAAEREQGYVLMCCTAPRSDHVVVAALEAGSALDIPEQQLRGRIHKLEQLGDDCHVLTVRTQRGRTLRFLAGQRARLKFDGADEWTGPLANCPCDGFNLQFHLSGSMDGASVEQLLPGLHKGLPVAIEGPYGDFTLDEGATRPLIFLAEDTGFAPIGSLIEHAVNAELERPMRLYWYAARPDGHYRLNYCRAWSDVVDDFDYQALASATTDEVPGLAQLDSPEMLPVLVVAEAADIAACDVYVAGSRILVDAAQSVFIGAGLASERLFLEVLPAEPPD